MYCYVTIDCILPPVFYSCPAIREDDEAGICVAECSVNSDCTSPTANRCCYTGCGYSCMSPVVTPYIPIPTLDTCPPTSQVPCAFTEGSCATEYFCDSATSICCPNDCASSVCVYRTGPEPCHVAQRIVSEGNTSQDLMLGRFSPECDSDGHFNTVQCHEHYCWCVDVHTGKPESETVASEHLDNLPCTSKSPLLGTFHHLYSIVYRPLTSVVEAYGVL